MGFNDWSAKEIKELESKVEPTFEVFVAAYAVLNVNKI